MPSGDHATPSPSTSVICLSEPVATSTAQSPSAPCSASDVSPDMLGTDRSNTISLPSGDHAMLLPTSSIRRRNPSPEGDIR